MNGHSKTEGKGITLPDRRLQFEQPVHLTPPERCPECGAIPGEAKA